MALQPSTDHKDLLRQLDRCVKATEHLDPPSPEDMQASCGPDVGSVFDTGIILPLEAEPSGSEDSSQDSNRQSHTDQSCGPSDADSNMAITLELRHDARNDSLYYKLHSRR